MRECAKASGWQLVAVFVRECANVRASASNALIINKDKKKQKAKSKKDKCVKTLNTTQTRNSTPELAIDELTISFLASAKRSTLTEPITHLMTPPKCIKDGPVQDGERGTEFPATRCKASFSGALRRG